MYFRYVFLAGSSLVVSSIAVAFYVSILQLIIGILDTKKDLIELFGINKEKISVVHLGIDQVKQKMTVDVSIDKSYLLYVGHRGGYKNFQGFLKAFAYSNRLRKNFCILAFGSDKFSNEELKLIDELGLDTKQVKHMLGSDEVLAALYQRAEVFIYPSLYEGLVFLP